MSSEERKAPVAPLLGAGLQPCFAGLKSRPHLIASQNDAPKFSILNSQFSIKTLPTTRYPLPTALYRSAP